MAMDALSTALKNLKVHHSVLGGHMRLPVNRDHAITKWIAVGTNAHVSPGTLSSTPALVDYGNHVADTNAKDG